MPNFDFSGKRLGIVSAPHFGYDMTAKSHYIPLPNQISLPNYFYFLRYCLIRVLQLFVSQDVTSNVLKLTLYFKSYRFYT